MGAPDVRRDTKAQVISWVVIEEEGAEEWFGLEVGFVVVRKVVKRSDGGCQKQKQEVIAQLKPFDQKLQRAAADKCEYGNC